MVFGGKRNLAMWIVEALGDHRVYWEPFCGSMAVLMAKPRCATETVNDLHGDIVNLSRVIQHGDHGPKLYRRLRRVLMAEELFKASQQVICSSEVGEELDPERAFHYALTAWMGRNGVAGRSSDKSHFCVRYAAHGGQAAKRWNSVIMSIPAWRERLRNVMILRRDALELLEKIADEPRTAIYIDPPYLAKAKKYKHDFDDQDHRELAEILQRFKRARVVVSYYAHPDLNKLYPGWSRRVKQVTKAMASSVRTGKNTTKAIEVLLINQPDSGDTPSLFQE